VAQKFTLISYIIAKKLNRICLEEGNLIAYNKNAKQFMVLSLKT